MHKLDYPSHEYSCDNMFVGIDHGTTAIRFRTDANHGFELSRESAREMADDILLKTILDGLGIKASDIDLMAMGYSMGDGVSRITDMRCVANRGVREVGGTGRDVGGGTHVFDVIRASNIPAIVIPGIHSGSDIDPRMKMFSHGASPGKVGITYHALLHGCDTFIVSDISSNTVTVGVADGKIIGAIDACIFAPGILHGPLDLETIRDIDAGKMSANEAFSRGGVLKHTSFRDQKELINAKSDDARLALDRLALFAAMEIAGMRIMVEERETLEAVFLSEPDEIRIKIEDILNMKTIHLDKWDAAIGCAEIARDVHAGKKNILGIEVDTIRMNGFK